MVDETSDTAHNKHICTNPFLVLNSGFDIVDCIRGSDFEVVLLSNILTKMTLSSGTFLSTIMHLRSRKLRPQLLGDVEGRFSNT